MNQWIAYIATGGSSLIVGLVLGWWIHSLAVSRDDRNRLRKGKDDFLKEIAKLQSAVPDRIENLYAFRDSTLQPLRVAIYNVQPFVSPNQFTRLEEIYTEYRNLDEKQLHWGISALTHAMFDPTHKPADQLLAQYFDRFKTTVG